MDLPGTNSFPNETKENLVWVDLFMTWSSTNWGFFFHGWDSISLAFPMEERNLSIKSMEPRVFCNPDAGGPQWDPI